MLDELRQVVKELRFLLARYDRRINPYGDGKDGFSTHDYARAVHARQQRGGRR